ncbi:hypothetical protein OPV22_030050 [Ensete ventricosum]|uniref:Uncharacterized protein n=1 Tax=Ensete ventricosum TaxID=4639 RepID=A0AAV8Q309_ENSVE|nr:hypothetical protein OPV22_030050 [Ensete ventricosum]
MREARTAVDRTRKRMNGGENCMNIAIGKLKTILASVIEGSKSLEELFLFAGCKYRFFKKAVKNLEVGDLKAQDGQIPSIRSMETKLYAIMVLYFMMLLMIVMNEASCRRESSVVVVVSRKALLLEVAKGTTATREGGLCAVAAALRAVCDRRTDEDEDEDDDICHAVRHRVHTNCVANAS